MNLTNPTLYYGICSIAQLTQLFLVMLLANLVKTLMTAINRRDKEQASLLLDAIVSSEVNSGMLSMDWKESAPPPKERTFV